ncbi:MAG: efflux RND transporter periplasmic adaptor subunit [Victivallales bacterium]
MKKVLPSLFLLLAFLVLPAADMTYDSLPVKVVLFPFREAILSTQIDGVVVKYNFRGGERFKKSDVLLKLDDKKYNNDLQRMRSLMKEAELNANYTRQKWEDNKRLFKEDLQSEIEVIKSELDAKVGAERYQTAQINYADALLQLAFCTIRAPFDGTVEKLLTREFETVRSGQPLISIIDDNQLLAVMNLPTAELPKIKIGIPVTFKVHENGKTVTGSVFEIAGRADHRSETIEIKVLIDNAEHHFSAGMSGTLMKVGDGNGK